MGTDANIIFRLLQDHIIYDIIRQNKQLEGFDETSRSCAEKF